MLRDTSATANATLLVVETRCDDLTVWRQRIEQRTTLGLPAHHQTTWTGLLDYLVAAEPRVRYPISTPVITVDTTRPLLVVLNEIMTWIAEQTDV